MHDSLWTDTSEVFAFAVSESHFTTTEHQRKTSVVTHRVHQLSGAAQVLCVGRSNRVLALGKLERDRGVVAPRDLLVHVYLVAGLGEMSVRLAIDITEVDLRRHC